MPLTCSYATPINITLTLHPQIHNPKVSLKLNQTQHQLPSFAVSTAVCCVVTLGRWANGSRRFERSYRSQLQGFSGVRTRNSRTIDKNKATWSFVKPGNNQQWRMTSQCDSLLPVMQQTGHRISVRVKAEFTLEQYTKTQRGSRDIALLFL